MGKGRHERYSYCKNIAHISAILWGYVFILYSCEDGGFASASAGRLIVWCVWRGMKIGILAELYWRNRKQKEGVQRSLIIRYYTENGTCIAGDRKNGFRDSGAD